MNCGLFLRTISGLTAVDQDIDWALCQLEHYVDGYQRSGEVRGKLSLNGVMNTNVWSAMTIKKAILPVAGLGTPVFYQQVNLIP